MKLLLIHFSLCTEEIVSLLRAHFPLLSVTTAVTCKEACEVFANDSPEMIICDEMLPDGNGVDLLNRWRGGGHSFSAVILVKTCDFSIARNAMLLHCIDMAPISAPPSEYILIVDRLYDDALRKIPDADASMLLVAAQCEFWNKLLDGKLSNASDSVRRVAARYQIPAEKRISLLHIKYRIRRPTIDQGSDIEQKVQTVREDLCALAAAISNIATELFCADFPESRIIDRGRNRIVLLLFTDNTISEPRDKMKAICAEFMKQSTQHLPVDFSCILAPGTDIYHLSEMFEEVRTASGNSVYFQNSVSDLNCRADAASLTLFPFRRWQIMLEEGIYQGVLEDLQKMLYDPVIQPQVNFHVLEQLQRRLNDILYELPIVRQHSLKLQGLVPADLALTSDHSVPDFLDSLSIILQALEHSDRQTRESESLIGKVKAYIRDNLDNSLTRDSIAAHFFVSSDYLNRLLKKSTGMSVMDFLLHERMRLACNLLSQSTLKVSEIAQRVGYDNFSYFSTIFKKYMGMTPNAYRKATRNHTVS